MPAGWARADDHGFIAEFAPSIFLLSRLLGFANMNIPAMTTTITGEDLSSSAP
jgi:hypothetical protein